jgi:quercetin dioxygenase-like cupin family protein
MDDRVMVAGEGRSIWVVGDRYTIKCSGKDTGGAYALLEAVVPPGAGPPSHIQSREDEAFYVLVGELQFDIEGRSFTATSGA